MSDFTGSEREQRGDVRVVRVGAEEGYDVVIGRGVRERLAECLSPATQRVLVIHPPTLEGQAEEIKRVLAGRGVQAVLFAHPDAEAGKSVSTLEQAWASCARANLTRQDAIVSLGGGASTDLGGFVAATWLRGIPNINLPTTLLGMVDAAVGGKTGINVSAGKNLVGAFYSPRAVLCDLDFLETLPAEELVGGLGEVVKCGFIADEKILELLERVLPPDETCWELRGDEIVPALGAARGKVGAEREEKQTAPNAAAAHARAARELVHFLSPALPELIYRCVRVKAEVVSADPRESSLREILNYGHTLGHAIERAQGYRPRHGQCVAVGCVFAACLAVQLGLASRSLALAQRDLFSRAALATSYRGVEFAELYAAMLHDKKVRQGQVRFVVVPAAGSARSGIVAGREELERAWELFCHLD